MSVSDMVRNFSVRSREAPSVLRVRSNIAPSVVTSLITASQVASASREAAAISSMPSSVRASAPWKVDASAVESERMSCASEATRVSSRAVVAMISFAELSTFAARSLSASATTAKPRPASPARFASTDALKATSRVCSAILVISSAASDTWRRVSTTSATPSPILPTAVLAWATRSQADSVVLPMVAFAPTTRRRPSVTEAIIRDWSSTVRVRSSNAPLSSAASRPSADASWAIFAMSAPISTLRDGAGAMSPLAAIATSARRVFQKACFMGSPRCSDPLLEAGADARDRLAVQLRDPRLRHAEHGPDLLEVHVLLVVHGHDVLLPFRQVLDRRDQGLTEALVVQLLDRIGALADVVAIQVGIVATAIAEVVEIEQL